MGVMSVITYLANMVLVKFPKHIRIRSYRNQNPESDVILRDSELYPIMLMIVIGIRIRLLILVEKSIWPKFLQQPLANCYNGYMVNNNNSTLIQLPAIRIRI